MFFNFLHFLHQMYILRYFVHQDNGTRGDEFMNLIQPIASHVPYMVAVGNHEDAQ
jgi:hypothetical protein